MIATGETHSIRDFLDVAFAHVGIDDWTPYVHQDPRFMRPAEVDLLIGDASKAREVLGWKPRVVVPRAGRAHGRRGPRGDPAGLVTMTRAFVTGISGQDGGYLAERLLADGVEVHALAHADEPPPRLPGGGAAHRRPDPRRRRSARCSSTSRRTRSTTSPRSPRWPARGPSRSSPPGSTAWRRPRSWSPPSRCRRAGRPVRLVQASSAEIFGEPAVEPAGRDDPDPPGHPVRRGEGLRAPDGRRLPAPRTCTRSARSSTTTSRRAARPSSSPARSPRPSPAIARAGPTGSCSATSTPAATGAGRRTTSTRWCAPPARTSPRDYVIATGRRPLGPGLRRRRVPPRRDRRLGRTWSRSTPSSSGPPTPPSSPATRPGRAQLLGWEPTVGFEELVGRMVDADLAR